MDSLGAALKLKKLAKNLAEKPRLIESDDWASKVVDLHRVVDVYQALFVMLEHHNEALVRVGLELVTDNRTRKILSWNEGAWYEDEEKRNWLRGLVHEKLHRVLKAVDAVSTGPPESIAVAAAVVTPVPDAGSAAEIARLTQRLEESEAALEAETARAQAAEALHQAAAGKVRHLQAKVSEAAVQAAEWELRVQEADRLAQDAEEGTKQLSALRAVQATGSAEGADVVGTAGTAHSAGKAASVVSIGVQTDQVENAVPVIRELQQKAGNAVPIVHELQRQLRDDTLPPEPQPRLEIELSQARQKISILEAKVAKLEAKEAALLEQLRKQAVVVEEMHAKIRQMVARGEAEGVGDIVKKLVGDVGLDFVLKQKSVWDRLYKDAELRIQRLEELRRQHSAVAGNAPGHSEVREDVMEELSRSDLWQRLAERRTRAGGEGHGHEPEQSAICFSAPDPEPHKNEPSRSLAPDLELRSNQRRDRSRQRQQSKQPKLSATRNLKMMGVSQSLPSLMQEPSKSAIEAAADIRGIVLHSREPAWLRGWRP